MREVVMQTENKFSTREATERLLKIVDSTYEEAYPKQVADNAAHLNNGERTQLLMLFEYF